MAATQSIRVFFYLSYYIDASLYETSISRVRCASRINQEVGLPSPSFFAESVNKLAF